VLSVLNKRRSSLRVERLALLRRDYNVFLSIVFDLLALAPERMSMQRPRRQAAQDALVKMRDVLEWEELPESSRRFRECAEQIDSELRAEVRQKSVLVSDLDPDEGCEDSVTEESVTGQAHCGDGDGELDAPDYFDPEDADFVVQDTQTCAVDADYCPSKEDEEDEEGDGDEGGEGEEEESGEGEEEESGEGEEEESGEGGEEESAEGGG
jgi:hypothetical protein